VPSRRPCDKTKHKPKCDRFDWYSRLEGKKTDNEVKDYSFFFVTFASHEFPDTMKILITGGTGYIGSHTAVELVEAGHEVVLLDNLSNSYRWIADRIASICGINIPFYHIDLLDLESVEAVFAKEKGFDGVIHFAALKAVGESVEHPLRYYRNNLDALINLLQCMQQHAIVNLVFSSSCTVYGSAETLPVDESTPLRKALSPYGNTKIISESIIKDVVGSSPLRGILLRYFNPVGAHHSGLIGELPMGVPNNLMPFIAQTAIGKRDMLKVYGRDYPTPDGTAIRDYIHVTDLAKAHVVAMERMVTRQMKAPVEVFNLGTGHGVSVLEMINAFQEVNGVKVPFEFAPRRPGDITAIWADASLALRELGWSTRLGVEEMVRSAWEWERKYEG
jgi:UDP-glucose 4-epimerase